MIEIKTYIRSRDGEFTPVAEAQAPSNGRHVEGAINTLWGTTTCRSAGVSTPLRFPDQYFDAETGLNYNYFRYYDPESGRYCTPAPTPSASHHASWGWASSPRTRRRALTESCRQRGVRCRRNWGVLAKRRTSLTSLPPREIRVNNASGRRFVEEVLTNPGTSVAQETGRVAVHWQELTAYRLPSGIGMRFTQSGDFVGFVS